MVVWVWVVGVEERQVWVVGVRASLNPDMAASWWVEPRHPNHRLHRGVHGCHAPPHPSDSGSHWLTYASLLDTRQGHLVATKDSVSSTGTSCT